MDISLSVCMAIEPLFNASFLVAITSPESPETANFSWLSGGIELFSVTRFPVTGGVALASLTLSGFVAAIFCGDPTDDGGRGFCSLIKNAAQIMAAARPEPYRNNLPKLKNRGLPALAVVREVTRATSACSIWRVAGCISNGAPASFLRR